MLVVERLARTVLQELGRLPGLSRIGLALMAVAFVADVVVHLSPALHHLASHGPQEHLAHAAGIVGMVLVLGGVIVDARRHRSRRRNPHAYR
ncbi:MAG: hypothetical protein M3Y29_04995 [Chloroflexota bacterium]|nr:hypothetical protein [Chloroflexota bacterium]